MSGPCVALVAASISLLAAGGCSPRDRSTAAGAATGTAAASPATPSGSVMAAPSGSAAPGTEVARALPVGATFRDLVRAARAVAGRPTASTCLLRGGRPGELATLEAPIDAEATALEDPPADVSALLDARRPERANARDLATGGPPHERVRTRWGWTSGGRLFDAVVFTPVSRAIFYDAGEVTLVATRRGVYITGHGDTVGQPAKGEARAYLELLRTFAEVTFVITAEADAPLSRVREALALVTDYPMATVAFGVPLAAPDRAWDRPGAPHRVGPTEPHACPELMASDRPGAKHGTLGPRAMGDASSIVQAAVAPCRDLLPVGGGGIFEVNMTIETSGRVVEACALDDDVGDLALRACVVEATRQLTLPKLSAPGLANLAIHLSFLGKRVLPLCDP